MQFLIVPALAAFLTVTAIVKWDNTQDLEEGQAQINIKVAQLPLERPQYEWVRCNCPNGSELGLTESDFIKHQMYLAGLEHEAEHCTRQPIQFYFPERRDYAQTDRRH